MGDSGHESKKIRTVSVLTVWNQAHAVISQLMKKHGNRPPQNKEMENTSKPWGVITDDSPFLLLRGRAFRHLEESTGRFRSYPQLRRNFIFYSILRVNFRCVLRVKMSRCGSGTGEL